MTTTDNRTAKGVSTPTGLTPSGTSFPASQTWIDTHTAAAGGEPSSATTTVHPAPNARASLPPDHPQARRETLPISVSPAGSSSVTPAIGESAPIAGPLGLADPTLQLLSDVLDDLESIRISNENRLRQLTRSIEDADGEVRGHGLDTSHPAVGKLAEIVASMAALEHQATLALQRQLRVHPLGPWVKSTRGIGEKQGARLLAVIGDPYIRPQLDYEDGSSEASRPRTVSELWAYCGYKPGQRRRKGQRSNWSTVAKSRTYLIAEAMLKAGNREAYDRRKAHTVGRLHAEACVRCGPSGKPALPGSPWSDGHRHADALRYVAKDVVLKGLWREGKRLHELAGGQQSNGAHRSVAAGHA